MSNWALQSILPQESPMIQTTTQLKDMILRGVNPNDPFRNKPAANELLFKAGGWDRVQAIAGYTLNKLGGPGELGAVIAANMGLLDPRALDSLSRRLSTDKRPLSEKIPFLFAMISHDNYGEYRAEKLERLEDEQFRAKARLLMPPTARDLYDNYYRNLKRQDKLTPSEQVMFEASKVFVHDIWGRTKEDGTPDPSSFYSRAVHATGKDGSKEAKETVRRDLESASSVIMQSVEAAKKSTPK